ncbi:hypothetical protein [Marinitoga aeolica]|uniref:Uncharacterized protein n=1 Tax=Marinitoga aeolica TaxID=2809031 RepID=A0ABY8PRD2_9BACT|nr:hypothetical protein [Marinitoga aeolica]WGS65177.1 hypothetical protein JRV97_01065 [Marinitoga aeolica]
MKNFTLEDFLDFIKSEKVLFPASIGLMILGGILIYRESKICYKMTFYEALNIVYGEQR